MGFLGNVIGGKPTYSTTDAVKNPQLQAQINSSLTDYSTLKNDSNNALHDYISKYLAGNDAAKANTGQEIGNISRYYNGDVENSLAAMRQQRQKAVLNAATLSSQNALRNMNLGRLGSQGGDDSYNTRLALKNYGDIATGAALDNANQTRGDFQALETARLGLTGQRNALADSLAGRALVPNMLQRSMYGQNQGFLSNIGAQDASNNIYGLQKNSRGGTADFFDNADQGIGNVFQMVGSAYSGGKGINTTTDGTNASNGGPAVQNSVVWPQSNSAMGGYGYPGGSAPSQYNDPYGASAYSNGGYYDSPSNAYGGWGSGGGGDGAASYDGGVTDTTGGYGSNNSAAALAMLA